MINQPEPTSHGARRMIVARPTALRRALFAAVAAVAIAPVGPAAGQVAYNMMAMDHEVDELLVYVHASHAPMIARRAVVGTVSDAAARLDWLAQFVWAAVYFPAVMPEPDPNERISTSSLWMKARTANNALIARCEYWRDMIIDDAGTDIDLSFLEAQIDVLWAGAQQPITEVTTAPRISLVHVQALIDASNDLITGFQSGIGVVPDVSNESDAVAVEILYDIVEGFHATVQQVCPND